MRLALKIITLAGLLCVVAGRPALADEPSEVVVRGQKFTVWPAEQLRAKGIEPRSAPGDQNSALLYIQAYNARVDLPEDLQDSLQAAMDGTWPEGDAGLRLKQWLDQNRPALDLARRAAAMPDYAMPVFKSPETDSLFGVLLPTLSEHRQLVRMLAVDATWTAAHGDAKAAMDNVLVMQRMANHCAGGGFTLIEHLVGVACQDVAARTVSRIAPAASIESADMQQILSQYQSLQAAFPGWEQALRNEEAVTLSATGDAFDSPAIMLSSGLIVHPPADPKDGWGRLGRRLSRLFLPDRTSRRNLKRYYDQLIAGARPARDGQPASLGRSSEQAWREFPAWDVLSRVAVPSLDGAFHSMQRGASNALRARLTLAAEAYRRKTGSPPQSLRQLVPDYLSEIPLDPTTGREFEYSPTGSKTGLEMISRSAAAAPAAAAPTAEQPGGLAESATPPPSEWRQYVERFAEQHDLTPAQRAAANAILAEVEQRAAPLQRGSATRIARLKEQLVSAATEAQRRRLREQLAAETKPIDQMFKELQKRLDALLTKQQRQRG